MRTLAILGAASIAALIAASSGALAWTQEQPAQGQNGAALDLSDPDNFKALQDKVNGKTQQSSSGFQFSAGTGAGPSGLPGPNPYGAPSYGRGSAFSYSPNPGFRPGGDN